MPMPIPAFTWVLAAILLLFPLPALADTGLQTPPHLPPAVVELKLFQLEHKDVIAIAVETQVTGAGHLLLHKLEPQYHINKQANTVEVTLEARPSLPELAGRTAVNNLLPFHRVKTLTVTAGENQLTITARFNNNTTQPRLTTVKRKPVKQADNTVIFRTYLVLTFADIAAGQPPKTLVIDPGHGGSALGATTNFLLEKDLNLDIALLSRDIFRRHGYDVYMTRTDDSNPRLIDRADAANILQADTLISIHNNSLPESAPTAELKRGATALYNSTAARPGKELAALIAGQLADTLRIPQYPLQDRPDLVLLNSTSIPAVIAEVSMLPHPQDAKMISQRVYRLAAAQAIFTATDKYFAGSPQVTAPVTALATPVPIAANTVNSGLAAAGTDGTLYYLALAGDIPDGGREKIFRLKPGETAPVSLTDDEAWNLVISGKYLYYSNWSDDHRLYRIKPDGTDKTKLGNHPVSQLAIAGNWLVYVKWTNSRSAQDNNIYRMPLTGGFPQKIGSDQAESVQVLDNWIYYLNGTDGYKIYRIKLNGTGRSKLTEDQAVCLAVADNTIYYSNYSDGQKLYALSTDGRHHVKLSNDPAGFIAAGNGYVYYTNASANHALYRMTAAGHNKQLVCDLGVGPLPIDIVNNAIYYNRQFISTENR